jgi:RNA polymerase sigma-70 factor (ECF subfamily)
MTTEKIWKDFNQQLLGFIKSKVSDTLIAEDILQEVFIKIHLKASTLSNSNKLTSWLYQITRNTIIDYYRKNQPDFSDEFPQHLTDTEEKKEQSDFSQCLQPFIKRLPLKYKEAILKTELGSLSQKDYAKELNLSYSATKSRVQRAKKMLHESFLDCCDSNQSACKTEENDPNCGC